MSDEILNGCRGCDALLAENKELTTWWKFEEACKNRACSKELEYLERITALESALRSIKNDYEYCRDNENHTVNGEPARTEAYYETACEALLGVQT